MKKSLISLAIIVFAVGLTGCTEEPLLGTAGLRPASANALRPKAMAILKSSLEHENAFIRTHAIEVAATSQCKEMAPYLLKRMRDSSVAVRFSAIVAVGDMQCVGYEAQVQSQLTDANPNIKIAAAYAMAKLNLPQHTDMIRKAVASADQTVRANAVLLLGKLGDKNDLDLLYTVMQEKDSSEKVGIQAVESIARLGDNRIYRTKLWAMQISLYADDRVMGIRGMGALGTTEAENAIVAMLKDDVQEVRLAAAGELGKLGNRAGEREVLDYFKSGPNLNRVNMANNMAVQALGYTKSSRLKVYLPATLESESEMIRLLGAQAVLLSAK